MLSHKSRKDLQYIINVETGEGKSCRLEHIISESKNDNLSIFHHVQMDGKRENIKSTKAFCRIKCRDYFLSDGIKNGNFRTILFHKNNFKD
jgi:hypothetical protein